MSDFMNLKEFMDMGFLQEVNRQFFHPLGLALMLSEDMDTGTIQFLGINDCRDGPAGLLFADGVLNADKADHVRLLREAKKECRTEFPECDDNGVQQLGTNTEGA